MIDRAGAVVRNKIEINNININQSPEDKSKRIAVHPDDEEAF